MRVGPTLSDSDPRSAASVGPDETLDSTHRGELFVIQRRHGYRFSVDALLLAAWAGRPRGQVVDLGTGCGIVPLLLAQRGVQSIVGLELQTPLSQLAQRNVQLNGCSDRVNIVQGDLRSIRELFPAERFDLVLSNPPYVPAGAGNLNPAYEKAIARHELTCSLPALACAARYLLKQGGRIKVVFPAGRLVELLVAHAQAGLEPRRMRLVYPVPHRPARLVLLEAVKGRGHVLETLPPLYLYDEAGHYTREASEILEDVHAVLDASTAQGSYSS